MIIVDGGTIVFAWGLQILYFVLLFAGSVLDGLFKYNSFAVLYTIGSIS